jgi:bacterial/archaeal transporter family-2 protein
VSGFLVFLGLALLGILAGASFVVQATVNSELRMILGSPSWAAFISYLGGTVVMALVVGLTRQPFSPPAALGRGGWWAWSGGIFGAVYVVITILLLPRLGATTVVALLVFGQMLTSLIVDHYGVLGIMQRSADLPRVLGAILVLVGVILIRR